MSTEDNKKIARRLLEEPFITGNLDVLDEFCAPSYQHNYFGSLAELKQAIVEIRSGFPDMRQTVEEMIAEDDKVVARVTWRGTHTGEYQGIAPTGKVLTGNGATFYRFVDGKLVDDRSVMEMPDVRQYLLGSQ
jgi:predicted ester cyclase